MEAYELPLVLFTVLGQAAIGMLLLVSLLEGLFAPADQGARKGLRLAGIAVAPLLVIALLASLFHLGTPLGAIRALRGVGNAWLSREIWVFALLTLLSVGYSYLWWTGKSAGARRTLGYVAAVVGLIGVWVTAMVYALPARPAWNSSTNTMTFLATALFLGGLVVVSMVKVYGKEEAAAGTAAKVAGTAGAAALVLMVVALGSMAVRSQTNPQVALSAQVSFSSWLFWGRLLIGMLLPTAVASYMLFRAKEVKPALAGLALVGALSGELMGRALFYASVMGPNLWGM